MKKLSLPIIGASLVVLALMGAGCSTEQPMTEEEQAAARGMTMEEYQETKEAAARMNMGIDEHMNMDE